jgi:hypothetical protein
MDKAGVTKSLENLIRYRRYGFFQVSGREEKGM